MEGWDVGQIDPMGVVEREESCMMDLLEVLVQVGKQHHGSTYSRANERESLPVKPTRRTELSTISERESVESVESMDSQDSQMSTSTLRPIRQRANDILTRIHALNPSLRPTSPTNTTVSRGTQTSPHAQPSPPRIRSRQTRPRRSSKKHKQKQEMQIRTDNDTESGIPSSIPLSYSSGSSPEFHIFPPINLQKEFTPRRNFRRRPFSPLALRSPIPPRSQSRPSSISRFRVDSPYTAALRRRRLIAIESLRKYRRPSFVNSRRHKVRVFNVGKDVADSTFAEDSDASPRLSPRHRQQTRVEDSESTTDALTDLERRVQALRIWGAIEGERKEWLMNEIKRKTETYVSESAVGSVGGHSHSPPESSMD